MVQLYKSIWGDGFETTTTEAFTTTYNTNAAKKKERKKKVFFDLCEPARGKERKKNEELEREEQDSFRAER